jgi:hypothetical protein
MKSTYLFNTLIFTCAIIINAPLVLAKESQSKEYLINRIILGGTTSSNEDWHTIKVNDCEITTYVYAPYKDQTPWPLYSSFIFDLRLTEIQTMDIKTGRRFAFIKNLNKNSTSPHASVISFKMQGGNVAMHEMPYYRHPKDPVAKSTRKGADGYSFSESTSFYILNTGLEDDRLPKLFSESLFEYQKVYCPLIKDDE